MKDRIVLFMILIMMVMFTACRKDKETVDGFNQNTTIELIASILHNSKLNSAQEFNYMKEVLRVGQGLMNEAEASRINIDRAHEAQIIPDSQSTRTVQKVEPQETIEPYDEKDLSLENVTNKTVTSQIIKAHHLIQDTDETLEPQSTKVPKETASIIPSISPIVTVTPQPTKIPIVTDTPQPTKIPIVTETPQPTVKPTVTVIPQPTTLTPTPTKRPIIGPEDGWAPPIEVDLNEIYALSVRGQTITIGERRNSIESKFGPPTRIDTTEYNYNFMVYNDDYEKFFMVAVSNGKVVGWYTDAIDFVFKGLSTKSSINSINREFGKEFTVRNSLSLVKDGFMMTFFIDTLENHSIEGILVVKNSVTYDGVTEKTLQAKEKQVMDLTNSFRARHGLPALAWSKQASNAARLHSQDMADYDYYDHIGRSGSTPGERLKAQRIRYISHGQNIIAGYGNVFYASNSFINSKSQRSNLLNISFTHIGVGYAMGGSRSYYLTQKFFS